MNGIDLNSRKLCPYYLVDCCPYELLTNTKTNYGVCKKEHDEDAKSKFQSLSLKEQWDFGFHKDLLRLCEDIIQDQDRKIRRLKERLAAECNTRLDEVQQTAQQDQIDAIEKKIKDFSTKIDRLAEEGAVDELDIIVAKVEKLREEKEDLLRAVTFNSLNKQKMEVCDVCGSYLQAGEAESRVMIHLQGKLHMGLFTLRQLIQKLRDIKNDFDQQSRLRSHERDSHRSDKHDRHRSEKDRHSDRHHYSDRDYHHRDQRQRERSRDRDHYRRERSRDHRDKHEKHSDYNHKKRPRDDLEEGEVRNHNRHRK